MAQIPALISFNPNTTILSSDVNSNFTSIRSVYNAHDIATTGIHGMGSSTIVGTDLTQTLTNKTFTSPTINTGALVSPVVTGDLVLNSGADLKIYSDVATTLKFQVDGATGDFGIPATRKFFLDGADLAGNTYLSELSADAIGVITGGSTALEITTSTVNVKAGRDLIIQAAKIFYLDGGNNTYLREASADAIEVVTGGSTALEITTSTVNVKASRDLLIQATQKFYLDGGGDTYIYESAANVMDHLVGGTNRLRLNSTGATVSGVVSATTTTGASHLFDSSGGLGLPSAVTINGSSVTLAATVTGIAMNLSANTATSYIIDATGSQNNINLLKLNTAQTSAAALGAYQVKVPVTIGGTQMYFAAYL